MYQHKDNRGNNIPLPLGKVVCVGRNYLDHVAELNNSVPSEALLFMKPSTAMVDAQQPVKIPSDLGQCHNELEIAALIQQPLQKVAPEGALQGVWGYGLGLDLTLRDLQSELKAKGYPWERAKAFDGSCPLTGFVPAQQIAQPQNLSFSLKVNDQYRQLGDAALMIRSMQNLISEISQYFTLQPGDVVLTGTPKGVSALNADDVLHLTMDDFLQLNTTVTV